MSRIGLPFKFLLCSFRYYVFVKFGTFEMYPAVCLRLIPKELVSFLKRKELR